MGEEHQTGVGGSGDDWTRPGVGKIKLPADPPCPKCKALKEELEERTAALSSCVERLEMRARELEAARSTIENLKADLSMKRAAQDTANKRCEELEGTVGRLPVTEDGKPFIPFVDMVWVKDTVFGVMRERASTAHMAREPGEYKIRCWSTKDAALQSLTTRKGG